jgi:hypothetical protein
VWHYYDKNGKLIRWGTTHFEKTTERQLADLLKEDSKESDKKKGEARSILHQIVFIP